MKLASVQSSNRGQKAFARPRLPLLWQFVSYQSVISDELPAQDWGGGSRESKHGVEVWVGNTLWRRPLENSSIPGLVSNQREPFKEKFGCCGFITPPFHPYIQP